MALAPFREFVASYFISRWFPPGEGFTVSPLWQGAVEGASRPDWVVRHGGDAVAVINAVAGGTVGEEHIRTLVRERAVYGARMAILVMGAGAFMPDAVKELAAQENVNFVHTRQG